MIGVANFEEVVEPSLDVSGFYVFIYIILSILGMYFIVSLLLQTFSDAYSSNQDDMAAGRRDEWYGLALTFMISVQHNQDKEIMSCAVFEQLLMTSSITTSWLGKSFVDRLDAVIFKLNALDISEQDWYALATICCQLDDTHRFQSLIQLRPGEFEGAVLSSLRGISTLQQFLVQHNICSSEEHRQV